MTYEDMFERATRAEIAAVAEVEADVAAFDGPRPEEDSPFEASLIGMHAGLSVAIAFLIRLQREHPQGDSMGAGFLAELLSTGFRRGLEHHGIGSSERE